MYLEPYKSNHKNAHCMQLHNMHHVYNISKQCQEA